MVLWMSIYNVTLHMGALNLTTIREAWIGFPIAYVFIMSLYGALEGCVKSGNFGPLLIIWLTNIPKNFVMALPFQLIVAGPLVRKVFRGAFPEGTVLA